MGAAQRRNLVQLNPIQGPSGAKLVGYNWEFDREHYVDQRGEDRERKVSAWDRAEKAGMTNRDIVHMFTVEGPDGKQQNVSLETAAKMLGFDGGSDQFKAKFKSATSAAKTMARLQMEKAQVEQAAASREKDLAELKQQAPAMDDDQTEEVPNFLGNRLGLRLKGTQSTAAFGGDGGRSKDEARKILQNSWIQDELKKNGHNPYSAPSVGDIDRRILRAKNKLDELTKQQGSEAPKPEAGPVVPPTVEPSAPAPKATSLPDRIKNLKVLLNKTRSSANAKALRAAIDQLEREAQGPVEAPKVETANPAASQAPASAEFDPASPPGVSAKDIPLDLAYNAHRGTSFVPEKRAQARVEEYVEDMKNIWSKLAKKATTPEQQSTLKDEFERFRKGYVEKNKAMLSAMSRQVSSMIAGPSSFPAARMRKRGDTANKRSEEFLEFRKKAVAAIERKLDPSINGIRQAAPDASSQLNSKAAELRKEQEKMKAANNLIRKELKTNRPQNVTPQQSEKLKAGLAAIGLDAREVSSILKPDYMGQIGYQDFMLRNNLANIKRQEQRQAEVQQFQQSAPQTPETEYDGGVTVTEHPEDQRIRIKFPGKPNSEQIRELKARGFKWAPSQKAWSRILTSNARTAAQSVMKELGLNKVGAETTTESRTLSNIRQQLREAFRQCP